MKDFKKINFGDKLFLAGLVIIVAFFVLVLFKGEKLYSKTENRVAYKFSRITFSSYFSKEYQNNLEKALADQIIGSETIKLNVKSFLKFVNYNNINESICRDRYVYLESGYYIYDCKDYLLKHLFSSFNNKVEYSIEDNLNEFNQLNKKINTYYYFISTSSIYNFKEQKYEIDVPKMLNQNLTNNYSLSALEFKTLEDYSKYFYKTDHHWNNRGSYKGYKDIIKMIYPNDKILEPISEVEFEDVNFFGSASRVSSIYDFKEKFKVYKFDYPDFKITINKISNSSYGNEELYFSNQYTLDKLNNHYGNFYGGDVGEIIIDTNTKQKENILIVATSFSNPINKLIATHFNKTYIVDLRHYKEQIGEEFNIYNYIHENEIDKVLFIMNYDFLYDDTLNLGQEN